MSRRSTAAATLGAIALCLVGLAASWSIGFSFDRGAPPGDTPTPSDPDAPEGHSRPAATPELEPVIPEALRGGWLQVEGTTYTSVVGGPDPSDAEILESDAWYEIDSSGTTTEYYAEFRDDGDLVQVIWESGERSILWTREPVLPPVGGASSCLVERQGVPDLAEARTIPFSSSKAVVSVGFSQVNDPELFSHAAIQQLGAVDYESLFARSTDGVEEVVALDQRGLAVFDYSAVFVDGVLVSERSRAISSVESRNVGPTIEIEGLCEELS